MWPATSSPAKATCQSAGSNDGDVEERRELLVAGVASASPQWSGEGLRPGVEDAPDQGRVRSLDRPHLDAVRAAAGPGFRRGRADQLAEAADDRGSRHRSRSDPVRRRRCRRRRPPRPPAGRRAGSPASSADGAPARRGWPSRSRGRARRVDMQMPSKARRAVVPVGPVDADVGDEPAVELRDRRSPGRGRSSRGGRSRRRAASAVTISRSPFARRTAVLMSAIAGWSARPR